MRVVLDITEMANATGISEKEILFGLDLAYPQGTPDQLIFDALLGGSDKSKREVLSQIAAHFVRRE